MNKYYWIAYGIKMDNNVILEVEASTEEESYLQALDGLRKLKVDFDTLELYDESFLSEMEWKDDNHDEINQEILRQTT